LTQTTSTERARGQAPPILTFAGCEAGSTSCETVTVRIPREWLPRIERLQHEHPECDGKLDNVLRAALFLGITDLQERRRVQDPAWMAIQLTEEFWQDERSDERLLETVAAYLTRLELLTGELMWREFNEGVLRMMKLAEAVPEHLGIQMKRLVDQAVRRKRRASTRAKPVSEKSGMVETARRVLPLSQACDC